MSVIVFPLLIVLIALALYPILRSFVRTRITFHELMSRILPAPAEPVIPGTWGEVSELLRVRKCSAIYAEAEDHYRRIIPACTDEDSVEEMKLTHRTFLSNHQKLNRALMVAFVTFCFGKIARDSCRSRMARVVKYYANEISLISEISEVMDESSVVVLEGQFLHGT
jgi:hypothetical protein